MINFAGFLQDASGGYFPSIPPGAISAMASSISNIGHIAGYDFDHMEWPTGS
jgi:hypothetical protein